MKKMFLLLLALAGGLCGFAQETEEDILNRFFELYQTDTNQAIDYLYGTNPWLDSSNDAMLQLKGQLEQNKTLIGGYIDRELLVKSRLGESFTAYVYMVKHERQPIRFYFAFYTPRDQVMTYAFEFDGKLTDEFKEFLKYEYLKVY
jgi:hypothetical protein